ncbi:LOW QUALITY PROTEIN: protein BFR2-like [Manacus vitellinus]|uniref:LOW QUALITY PROTEIN: protein BFR2-like n=1 Tax=Manacus vitellinus TaxID=328815 RepID=UPI00115D684E|nr:LOW QUALITY PROTEIN: protein BFR2-like [Manacus vitellinus]
MAEPAAAPSCRTGGGGGEPRSCAGLRGALSELQERVWAALPAACRKEREAAGGADGRGALGDDDDEEDDDEEDEGEDENNVDTAASGDDPPPKRTKVQQP